MAGKNGTKKQVSESEYGHFRGGNLEGGSAGPISRAQMVPQVAGRIVPLGTFFSDAYLIDQLANKINEQIFEIELGHGNGSEWHKTLKRNQVFRPKFVKMGRFSAKKWNKNGIFFVLKTSFLCISVQNISAP